MRAGVGAAFGVLALVLPTAALAADPPVAEGMWRAWLDYPDHQLPFRIEIAYTDGQCQAWIRNGPERIPFQSVEQKGPRLALGLEHYGGMISVLASPDGRSLSGTYRRSYKDGSESVLPIRARHGEPRFLSPKDTPPIAVQGGSIDGRWALGKRRGNKRHRYDWVMELKTRPDGSVLGNTARVGGDWRYLVGTFTKGRLRLSTFDGAHAILYDGVLTPTGELTGRVWFGRQQWSWTASLDPSAKLPDPFGLTTWREDAALDELHFKDLTNGATVSLLDPRFDGKARIVYLLGTWCPNCTDQTQYMVELQRRYGDRGLSIVGLSYELTENEGRVKELLAQYTQRHGVTYPVLFGGLATNRCFPPLKEVVAFPTTVFFQRDGVVKAVHTGFSGPASGARHEQLRASFEELIEELLAD